MAPSIAKHFANSFPTIATITNTIQESIPEEVKQKLRSWHESILKHAPQAFQQPDAHPRHAFEKVRKARQRRASMDCALAEARRASAEMAQASNRNGKARERPTANTFTRRHSYAAFSGPASMNELKAKVSESAGDLTNRMKRTSSNVRNSFSSLKHAPSSANLGKRVRKPTRSSSERKYSLEFSSHRTSAAPSAPRLSTSTTLIGSVRGSVKRLARSASQLSSRSRHLHLNERTDHARPSSFLSRSPPPTNERIDHTRPPSFLSRSPPPTNERIDHTRPSSFLSRSPPPPNEVQRSYSSTDFLHPDQYPNAQGPILHSIAERNEDVFRTDMIFAAHESRMCTPGPPPTFVERLPFRTASSSAYRSDSLIDMDGAERSAPAGPERSLSASSRQHSTLSFKLMDQIDRANELRDLRDHINTVRHLYSVPALVYHQNLCLQASIVATLYEVERGEGTGAWNTRLRKSLGTVELVGPANIKGKHTAEMWALDRDMLYAINDPKWTAIGISRTAVERRWVAVLAAE